MVDDDINVLINYREIFFCHPIFFVLFLFLDHFIHHHHHNHPNHPKILDQVPETHTQYDFFSVFYIWLIFLLLFTHTHKQNQKWFLSLTHTHTHAIISEIIISFFFGENIKHYTHTHLLYGHHHNVMKSTGWLKFKQTNTHTKKNKNKGHDHTFFQLELFQSKQRKKKINVFLFSWHSPEQMK